MKASRKIDREYERRMEELYAQVRGESTTTTSTSNASASPRGIDEYSSAKIEVYDSEDEELNVKITKLEGELVKVQTSLNEKEQIIGKLQKTPRAGDVCLPSAHPHSVMHFPLKAR
jgi:hypothetical protein